MENNNINLLDLNNDILNIIGKYVMKDNERRMDKEDSFKSTDRCIEYYKKEYKRINKEQIISAIHCYLYKTCCTKEEVQEYIETRNLTNIIYD